MFTGFMWRPPYLLAHLGYIKELYKAVIQSVALLYYYHLTSLLVTLERLTVGKARQMWVNYLVELELRKLRRCVQII